MEVWRTFCPKLPVWEDATDGGLVRPERVKDQALVRETSAGSELLTKMRPVRWDGPGTNTCRL